MNYLRKILNASLLIATAMTLSHCDDPPFGNGFASSTIFTSFKVQLGAESVAASKITSAASNDLCNAVAYDKAGNVFCGGFTQSNLAETNGGGRDAVLVKLDKNGNVLWVKQLGSTTATASASIDSTSGNEEITSIAVDTSGNVYCAGYTSGNLTETNGGGGSDVFFMKMSSGGIIQWIKQLGATTSASSATVGPVNGAELNALLALSASGTLYSAISTTSSFTEINGGNRDILFLKFNSSGDVAASAQIGSATATSSNEIVSAAGDDYCLGLAVDTAENLYCAGTTSGSLAETNGGSYDAVVLKLATAGTVDWATQLGSDTAIASTAVNSAAGNEGCAGVGLDSSSNVYCTGDTDGDLAETNGGGGNFDLFALRMSSGGALNWVSQLGSVTAAASSTVGTTIDHEFCNSTAVDRGGSVYCGGQTHGPIGETTGAGLRDSVAVKWNSNGEVQWVRQFGTVTITDPQYSTSWSTGIKVSDGGYIYLAGATEGDLAQTSGGLADLFIARLKPDGSL